MPAARGGLVSARLSGARGGRRTGGPSGKALQRAGDKVLPNPYLLSAVGPWWFANATVERMMPVPRAGEVFLHQLTYARN